MKKTIGAIVAGFVLQPVGLFVIHSIIPLPFSSLARKRQVWRLTV